MNMITADIPRLAVDFPYMKEEVARKLQFNHGYILDNFWRREKNLLSEQEKKSEDPKISFDFDLKAPEYLERKTKVTELENEHEKLREKVQKYDRVKESSKKLIEDMNKIRL